MEQLNNKIKDIYNQENTPLPDELNWDEMKGGIFEKMKNQEDEPAPFPLFSNGSKFLLLALVLIFASATIYLLVNNSEKKQINNSTTNKLKHPLKNNSTVSKRIQKESKIKPDNENKLTLSQNNLINKNAPVLNSIQQEIEVANDVDATQSVENKKNVLPKTLKTSIKIPVESYLITNTNSDGIINASNKSKENNNLLIVDNTDTKHPVNKKSTGNKKGHYKTDSKIEPNNSKLTGEKFVTTTAFKEHKVQNIYPLIKKSTNLTKHLTEEKITHIEIIPEIEGTHEKKLASNAIKLHGGITYMKSPFNKTTEAQFKSETGFLAYYVNASYNRTFTNGFYLSLGSTYSRLKSKFELSDTIIHSYLVENVPTKRITNVLTGRVIRTEHGNAHASALSSRQVRHYNKFDALSIPVIIGKQWHSKRFSYHVGIGSDVSIYNWSEGKTLRDNMVIAYSRSQSGPYHTGLRVAALAEAGIGISINNHIEIITNFRNKMNLLNWSADELNVKPHVFLLGTGVKLKF